MEKEGFQNKDKFLYIIYFVLFNIFFVIPSFRFLLKFTSEFFLVLFSCIVNTLFYFFLTSKFKLPFQNTKIWIVGIIFLASINYFVYPKVDARKNIENKGSTADDAIILATKSWENNGLMYDLMISEIEPISPGPGWVILNSPFIHYNIYFLFSPFYILLLFYTLKRYEQNNTLNNYFLFVLCLSCLFWEMFFNGHDIIPLSFSLFISAFVYMNYLKDNLSYFYTILIAVFVGLVSTSRIVFAIYPFILFFLGLRINQQKAWLVLVISSVVCFGLHGYFYLINSYYQPFHLLIKAKNILGILPLSIFTFLFLFITYKLTLIKKEVDYNLIIAAILSIFLLPISYGDLIRCSFEFKIWEGANYIFPILPFLIYYSVKKFGLSMFFK